MSPLGVGGLLLGPDTVPFNPLSLSPVLWVNGRAGILTNDFGVNEWEDQSGNGNNYTQTGVSGDPYPSVGTLNGFTALVFAASSSQTLANTTTFTALSAFTMFAVWQYTGMTDYNAGTYYVTPTVLSFSPSFVNGIGAGIDSGDTTRMTTFTGVFTESPNTQEQIAASSASGTVTDPHQSYHAYDGSHLYASIDGGTVSSLSVGSTLTDGAFPQGNIGLNNLSDSSFWNGSIGEIMVFDTFLNDTDISNVQAYLNTQWGL